MTRAKETILIIPGRGGSEPAHWQSWLQRVERSSLRVEQDDWKNPRIEAWSDRIQQTLDRISGNRIWLVAHSFGCLATAYAAGRDPGRIAGSLLVAPADPRRFGLPELLLNRRLPFPSMLVASTTDPWMQFCDAAQRARHWGSELVNLGPAGHINVEAGFGPWPELRSLLQRLRYRAAPQPQQVPENGTRRSDPAQFIDGSR